MDYDRWKTTPPEPEVPCDDCGTPVSEERALTAFGHGPLCADCHELYNPDLP